MGSPEFYSILIQKIIDRGLDKFENLQKISELANTLSKATNVHSGGYGYYNAIEKHILE
jgi:hypothetical protein